MNDYGTARAFDNPERVAENLSKPRTRRVDWVRSVVNLLVGLSLLQIVWQRSAIIHKILRIYKQRTFA
jgi:hypothetical protein